MPHENIFRNIPSVDAILKRPAQGILIHQYGTVLVTQAVRDAVAALRNALTHKKLPASADAIDGAVAQRAAEMAGVSLIGVINATGVILHTNLGRAPLGETVLRDIADVVTGYSTVEFDMQSGGRGSRGSHVGGLLRFLTGAEDAIVVNNNAAAIVLVLSTLAKRKEVIVSRGELIEIGGEFRIPDIMAASGCKMTEVGTTNRTRIADYEKAISDKTALLFKAHRSNFTVTGFVEEASLQQCAKLAAEKQIPFVYDIGSGLIRRPALFSQSTEPDVRSAVSAGADLVLFSCDKLLGGPQAGVIAGTKELVAKCAKAPLMRALRVGKLTLAALASSLRSYLSDDSLMKNNPTFAMLSRSHEDLHASAERLADQLREAGIECHVEDSQACCGGGTLPDLVIPSSAVVLDLRNTGSLQTVHARLRMAPTPVVAILREGRLLLDMCAVSDADIPHIVSSAGFACTPES